MEVMHTGVLVLGAGLAGLAAAWAAREDGAEVTVLSKGACASPAILGFNAAVGANDSAERFAQDTWEGGWRLGDPKLVETLARESSQTVRQMEALGQAFDRSNEIYQLLQPLGCSVPRLVHSQNVTGKRSMELLRQQLEEAGTAFLEGWMAAELVVQEGCIRGAVALGSESQLLCVQADAVVLACGGSHLLKGSTYPLCQTADGFAMAYRAGADLTDMEFVQHEPCRAVWPKPLGISTTLLAKGGMLTNALGERFILRQYPSEGAVPKDILARLIALEIAEGRGTPHGGVWLDLTGLPEDVIKVNHKLYYDRFLAANIDLTHERVEVGPGAHSMMGGVRIDKKSFTGIPGLYAAGEVTGGLHGANRLGGNAGAETYVFGRIAGHAASRCRVVRTLYEESITNALRNLRTDKHVEATDYEARKEEFRQLLANAVGPVREAGSLRKALRALRKAERALDQPCRAIELRARLEALNLAQVGGIVCEAALARTESRGVHYRSDYPTLDETWQRHLVWNLAKEREQCE